MDISSHQQSVDWEAVKAAGVDFAILRAGYRGYTEGAIQEDETFLTNLAAAKAAGLKVGVYFFSQALDKAEAVEEAEFVLNLLDGAELDYPIFFDWEDIEAEARTDGMDSVTLTACAVAFCKRVELNGYRAGVYFNQRFGFEEFDLRDLQDYELWLAEYALSPSFPYHLMCGNTQTTDALGRGRAGRSESGVCGEQDGGIRRSIPPQRTIQNRSITQFGLHEDPRDCHTSVRTGSQRRLCFVFWAAIGRPLFICSFSQSMGNLRNARQKTACTGV